MYFELDEKRFVGYDGDGVEWEAEQIEIDGEIVPNLETVERTGLTLMSYDAKKEGLKFYEIQDAKPE